jgi:ATP-dependent RNA helicase RhlE
LPKPVPGKTASFVLPILELFHRAKTVKTKKVNVLVLVPTRELAAQVTEVFQTFGAGLPNPVKTVAVTEGWPLTRK